MNHWQYSYVLVLTVNCCSRVELPSQHVHRFLCSFYLLVLSAVQQPLNLHALQVLKINLKKGLLEADRVIWGT